MEMIMVFLILVVVFVFYKSSVKSTKIKTGDLRYFKVTYNNNYIGIYPLKNECLEFPMAGVTFRRNIDNYLGEFVGELHAEPRNPHDPNAIKIVAVRDNHHVGYVPKDMTAKVRSARTLPCVCYCYIAKRGDQYITNCYINLA